MKNKSFLVTILLLLFTFSAFTQQTAFSVSINLSVDKTVQESFKKDGRLYIFLSKDSMSEPRTQIWPNPRSKTYIFAKNIPDFNPKNGLIIKGDKTWFGTPKWTLDKVPEGEYYVQILWDQDTNESRIDAQGNIYSKKQKLVINGSMEFKFLLDQKIPSLKVDEHSLSRVVDFKSDTLSNWWKKEVRLKAAIFLPHNYDKNKPYAIRYNVAGYGGRYTRINSALRNKGFMEWWTSAEAPEVINVFLDGEGPFGDSYQMDSDNSGPYGYSLINELIPHIESQYRGTNSTSGRYVDGCSTGGWVSLGLQLYYPDVFDGVYSYSPDAIEFENYQLINIYKDNNAFKNEYGYERPVQRAVSGEPMLSLRDFIQYENVLGSTNTYVNSGGQFSAHTALYSPKGKDGFPKPLFDPQTGDIDKEVAEYWKKYDFKLYAKNNWTELGPKLQGKIYVWMGDMDNFYLNPATRAFDDYLKTTQNPKSDAVIEFTPMAGHCSEYSNKRVLLQISDKIKLIK
jgi:S-formylglutathione hydrolase FrmB